MQPDLVDIYAVHFRVELKQLEILNEPNFP